MEHASFVGYAHEDDVARKQRIGCVRFEHQVVVNAVKRGIYVGDLLSGFGIGGDDSDFELRDGWRKFAALRLRRNPWPP